MKEHKMKLHSLCSVVRNGTISMLRVIDETNRHDVISAKSGVEFDEIERKFGNSIVEWINISLSNRNELLAICTIKETKEN